MRTLIHAPPDVCFDLSLSVDAHTSSMARSTEQVVAGVAEGQMTLHESVTWRATHFGVPFRMTAGITAYDRPRSFVDEQLRGPFKTWVHRHKFEAVSPAVTEMIDDVSFEAPLGPVGTAVSVLVLDRYMRNLLHQRNQWLKAALEADRADGLSW